MWTFEHRLTFRIGPSLFKYIETLYEKVKKYKKEKERNGEKQTKNIIEIY